MLQGKRALVVGVGNARSIAWAIADRWRREGAEVFITYQNERFRGTVEKLLRENWRQPQDIENDGVYNIPAAPCDVANEDEIAALFRTLQQRGFCSSSSSNSSNATTKSQILETGNDGNEHEQEHRHRTDTIGPPKIDAVLHSVAHAPADAMQGVSFLQGTTKDSFVSAHVVSAYSLVSTVRHALPYLAPGASVMALTYIGSQRAAKNYNVMGPAKASLESCARALAQELGSPQQGGIRVNCLSPGPVRTIASRGISGFDEMRREAAQRAPLCRDTQLEEIAGAATFLASPLASCVTGQTINADCGFSSVI